MDSNTVPTSPAPRQPLMQRIRQHLRDHGVDLAIALAGTAAFIVGATAGPILIAAPAALVTAVASGVLVRRNGDDR